MRIAYLVTRGDAVGGATIHVRDLACAMRARGDDVVVLIGGRGEAFDLLVNAGLVVRSLTWLRRPVNPLWDYRALGEISGWLREWGPDLVSAHTAKAGWLGRAVCSRLGIPVIYTPHGWSIGDRISRAQGALFLRAERTAARWGDAIVCVCEYERRLALAKSVASGDKLHVIHNGVADVPPELRARPADGPPRIVAVARFEPPKDHATLLEALARLAGEAWELELVGDGPQLEAIRALAARLGIAGRVRFAGYAQDPATVLSAAQLFVLSSRSEGFPRSILEAMRAGLPVVASNVGGVGEAVIQGENGVVVEAGDVEGWAAAIRRMIGDAPARARFGAASRAAYEARFRLERTVAQTSALYAAVLAARRHGA